MFRTHPVTIGLIFMNPDNYPRFEQALESILRWRFFNIKLVLVDNTGQKFFTTNPCGNPLDGIISKATGFPLFRQWKDLIDLTPRGDAIQLLQNEQILSVAENWNNIFRYSGTPVVIYCNDDIVVNRHFDWMIYETVMKDSPEYDVVSFKEVPPIEELMKMEWTTVGTRDTSDGIGFNGCCWGTTWDVLREVGMRQGTGLPFDPRFKLACYEDLDFYKLATEGSPSFSFLLHGGSFVFHHGASTRNSLMVQRLQNDHTKGLYHIDYNRMEFLKKYKMTVEQLKEFEAGLYKGWGDPERLHAVEKAYRTARGDKK